MGRPLLSTRAASQRAGFDREVCTCGCCARLVHIYRAANSGVLKATAWTSDGRSRFLAEDVDAWATALRATGRANLLAAADFLCEKAVFARAAELKAQAQTAPTLVTEVA